MERPKRVKKSWRETIGVKVRSEILSPGQNFLFWPIWYDVPGTLDSFPNLTPVVRKISPQNFLPVLVSLRPKVPIRTFWPTCDQNLRSRGVTRFVKFLNFFPGENIRYRNFTTVNPKVSLQDFLLILAVLPTKITNRSFSPRCDQMGRIFKIFTWREYVDLELEASGPESFPPGFFIYFGRTTGKNFDSVFLIKVRPNGSSAQILLILGHRALKMCKKSWRESFGISSVKVRSLSRSKFWEFEAPQKDRTHILVASRSKRLIRNFRPWGAQSR